jgi:hypothetical protein
MQKAKKYRIIGEIYKVSRCAPTPHQMHVAPALVLLSTMIWFNSKDFGPFK